MNGWLLAAPPILVVLLVVTAELLQAFQIRHLPRMSAVELAEQQPALRQPGLFLRYWPRIMLGLGFVVIIARVNRLLDRVGTIRALMGVVLLWLLVVILLELAFGLTYRVVRGAGGPAGRRDQYRVGIAVQRCGWYRLLLWLAAFSLMFYWLQAN